MLFTCLTAVVNHVSPVLINTISRDGNFKIQICLSWKRGGGLIWVNMNLRVSCLHASVFRQVQCKSETHLRVSCLHASDRSSAAQRHTSGSAVSIQTGPVQLRDTPLGQLSPFRQVQCSSETHLRVSCLHSDKYSEAQRHISGSDVSMLQTGPVQLRDTSPGQISPCFRQIQCSSETHLRVSCLHTSDRYSAAQRHISGSAVSMLQTDTVQLRDTSLGQLSPCFRQIQCSSETHLWVSCLHAVDRYSAAQRHISILLSLPLLPLSLPTPFLGSEWLEGRFDLTGLRG